MASRKLREPSTAVYQFGRGSEPMIEVGRAIPADALYIVYSLRCRCSGFAAATAQKSYASLFGATSRNSERSGAGSGSPESRKRLTIG